MVEEWRSSAEKGDSVEITHFTHRSWHKYTRVVKGRDGGEIKSMIVLVLVKRGYAATCEGGERDGTRTFRQLCCTV